MDQKPDTREENLRRVKDDMVRIITDQQEQLGMMRDPHRAAAYIDPIIDEQAKKTDEVLSKPAPEKPRRPSIHQEEGYYQRSLGTAMLDGKGGAEMVRGDLRGRRSPADEQTMIRERLALLAKMPEWHQRVMRAWDSGGPAHVRADKVMEVIEASHKVFGDPRQARGR